MYVDQPLEGIRAVQTLSRLNRSHPGKEEVFVLDFRNKAETIQAAFQDYYQTTILSREADPDKLYDFKDRLDAYRVYTWQQVERFVELTLGNAPRYQLDPLLDTAVYAYTELDEEGQVDFKKTARAFVRNYNFLSSILPYAILEWEKLSIFLSLLVRKLPAPPEENEIKGMIEAIDMETYRAQKRQTIAILLADKDAEIDPAPISTGGDTGAPEVDRLSNIINDFNERFSHIPFNDREKILNEITGDVPNKVASIPSYRNAMQYSDRQSAKVEAEHAVDRVMNANAKDNLDLYKNYKSNPDFRAWLLDTIFTLTYDPTRQTGNEQPSP